VTESNPTYTFPITPIIRHFGELPELSDFGDYGKKRYIKNGKVSLPQVVLGFALDYEDKVFSMRRMTREADLVRLLIALESSVKDGILPLSVIADAYNAGKPDKEHRRPVTIARWLYAMDFQPRALKREGKLVKGIIYNRELLELWAKRFGIDIQAKLELGKTPEGEGWVPCLFKEDLPEMSVLDPKTGYARAVGPFVKGQVSALPRPSAELLRQRKVVDILEGKNNQG